METSQGNGIFFLSIPAVSTYMHFWFSWGLTIMWLLTRAQMPLYTVPAWFILSAAEGSVPRL
ncbi:hypothetical protein [Aequorivita flava]|uniref:Uncharacterized protein n=1 Tax=Aequorivita flava TaxID=3114371 RepID=A0AB35YU26_9FLAO